MPRSAEAPRVGTRFGSRVVRGHLGLVRGRTVVVVECDCGTIGKANAAELKAGRMRRCKRCGFIRRNGAIPIVVLRRLLAEKLEADSALSAELRRIIKEWQS